jgi:hypothetical protein
MEIPLDQNPSSSNQPTSIDILSDTTEEKYTIDELKKTLEKYRIYVENICEFIPLYASKGTEEKILDEMHITYYKELAIFEKMEEHVMKLIERDENGTEAPDLNAPISSKDTHQGDVQHMKRYLEAEDGFEKLQKDFPLLDPHKGIRATTFRNSVNAWMQNKEYAQIGVHDFSDILTKDIGTYEKKFDKHGTLYQLK